MPVLQNKYSCPKCRKPYSFQLPVELEDLRGVNLPLYVFVALWGLRRGEPLTVKNVRQAFSLSIRQASDVLEYMTEQGNNVVEVKCRLRPLKQGDRRMRREWQIVTVYGERIHFNKSYAGKKDTVATVEVINSRHNKITELRRWFAERHTGNAVPDSLFNVK